ncbi:hypothetical protein BGZ82_006965, partial [Podila clonocystis]
MSGSRFSPTAYTLPVMQTEGKKCARCNKEFTLWVRSKKNCHNCVTKMDDSALKNLSIKALKSYLGHYNIPTAGMIEKSELIKAVKDNKPLPEASQVHFRQQLPNTPDKLVVFLDEFAKLGKTSATTSQPISSPDTLLQDLDLFFKKLTKLNLNGDQHEVPKSNPASTSTSTSTSTSSPTTTSPTQTAESTFTAPAAGVSAVSSLYSAPTATATSATATAT